MPQTFTSIERDNPPPRRKSCLACTKARRRCDQANPACQRCAQRNIDCQYPQTARSKRANALLSPPTPASPSAPALGTKQQVDSPFEPGATTQESLDLDLLDSILEPCGDFLGDLFPAPQEYADIALTPDLSQALIDPRLPTATQQALDRSRVVTNIQASKDIASRLKYAIDKITTAPLQMVLENRMPWCHAHLYDEGVPRSMQDAISSAALHAAKNNVNARVIQDCIESRVQDLLSSPIPAAPLDLIARAHALLMYQTLRLLDTEDRVRHCYEATMPLLEEAAHSLIPHITFHEPAGSRPTNHADDDLPLYPISAARGFWNSWVFQESARRTLAVILFFVLTYEYMKGERHTKCGDNTNVCRSVTLSAHLWQAGDPVDFALAWRNKRHFVAHNEELDSVTVLLEEARSDDIDEFGKICLTGLMGADEAKGWLALKGVTL